MSFIVEHGFETFTQRGTGRAACTGAGRLRLPTSGE